MTRDEHIEIHKELHKSLDKLLADFVSNTGKRLSETKIMEFLEWSYVQTVDPKEIAK